MFALCYTDLWPQAFLPYLLAITTSKISSNEDWSCAWLQLKYLCIPFCPNHSPDWKYPIFSTSCFTSYEFLFHLTFCFFFFHQMMSKFLSVDARATTCGHPNHHYLVLIFWKFPSGSKFRDCWWYPHIFYSPVLTEVSTDAK